MSVAEKLARVRERIRQAESSAGRPPFSVRLIAVSKLQPSEAIREAYAEGQRDFGENYVQELCDKAASLSELGDLSWHVIGHLQRNKAQKVARLAASVHTVDSIELARELGKRAGAFAEERAVGLGPARVRLEILVEVSIAGEAQKSGVSESQLEGVLKAVETEPALLLKGLMCVPPFSERAEEARVYFAALAALRDKVGGVERLPELSMGMTGDLEYAVACGATQVRVGTAIFGARPAPSISP